ncbi:MAG: hypothetical protein QOH09_977 [Pseudonocardiales bacterium]|nr:hypothetical protein [Pseudonocardiales bacterium]
MVTLPDRIELAVHVRNGASVTDYVYDLTCFLVWSSAAGLPVIFRIGFALARRSTEKLGAPYVREWMELEATRLLRETGHKMDVTWTISG